MLLFAKRAVAVNEILYYDYNALVESGFDTKDFV